MEFQIIAGELCLDFINTLDNRPSPEHHKELLLTYPDLVNWAAQAGAISAAQRSGLLPEADTHPQAAENARRKAIALRECLFRIVSASLKNRRPRREDLSLFSHFLAEAASNLELQAGRNGFRLRWHNAAPRLDSPLWPIVKSASDLLTSDDLSKVRECDSATCRWLFIDRSKNHSRRWCDMKLCGNRLKARRFYHRRMGKAEMRKPL